jgi:hypothetical protein
VRAGLPPLEHSPHGRRAYPVTQAEQLALDPLVAPAGILSRQPLDQHPQVSSLLPVLAPHRPMSASLLAWERAWAAVRVCQRAVRQNLRYSQQNEMFCADHWSGPTFRPARRIGVRQLIRSSVPRERVALCHWPRRPPPDRQRVPGRRSRQMPGRGLGQDQAAGESEMLTKPCRSIVTQFGRCIFT